LSQTELQRVKVIENVVEGRITVARASELLKLSTRQVKRLKKNYRADSVDWVRHGNRGRPKPWRLAKKVRSRIVELARTQYAGFNDSHFTQKLNEVEGIQVSRETGAPAAASSRLEISAEAAGAKIPGATGAQAAAGDDGAGRRQPRKLAGRARTDDDLDRLSR